MKCPSCDHNIVEQTAKFCSQCGCRLSAQPLNTTPESVESRLQVQVDSPHPAKPVSIKHEEPEDQPDPNILHIVVCKDEVTPERESCPSLLQEEPEPPHIKEEQEEPEPPHIKEEQEELLLRPEEPDGPMLTSQVKSDVDHEDLSSHCPEVEVEVGLESDTEDTEDSDEWEEETSGGVMSHLSQSSQTPVFSCSECPYGYTSKVKLYKHIKRAHNDLYCQMLQNGQITSAACQPVTNSVTSQKEGDTDQPRSCDDSQSADVPLLQSDAVTGEEKYACKLCEKSFSQADSLRRHQHAVHAKKKPFTCKTCGKSYSHSGDLHTHQKVHGIDKSLYCELCDRSFSRTDDLKRHQRFHAGEKPFQCKDCDKSFFQACDLKRHERIHTGEQPYHCKYCGKSFSQSGDVKKHQSVHTGEKPYHCRFCDKTFSHSSGLTIHERVHTGEKPFKCQFCDKSFLQSAGLRTHLRLHTGERPFLCKHCGKTFLQSSNLNTHMRSHTGEKPFRCKHCEKSYRHSGHLKKHQRVHGEYQ